MRGDVPPTDNRPDMALDCSPFPWGCSVPHVLEADVARLFPTPVGMFLSRWAAGCSVPTAPRIRRRPRRPAPECRRPLRLLPLHRRAWGVREGPSRVWVHGRRVWLDRRPRRPGARSDRRLEPERGRGASVRRRVLCGPRVRPVVDLLLPLQVRGCVRVCGALEWGPGQRGAPLRIGGPQPPSLPSGKGLGCAQHPARTSGTPAGASGSS